MSISFVCKNCSRVYHVAESLAGKKARCKDCGAEFRVPEPPPAAQPAAPRSSSARPASSKSSRPRSSPSRSSGPLDPGTSPALTLPKFDLDGAPAAPRARRFEVEETPPPPRAPSVPRYEVDDEPIAPRRAPATWTPKQIARREAAGDSHELCTRPVSGGIFSMTVGTILYEMPRHGYVLVTNGVAADPTRQINLGYFLMLMGFLGLLVGLALVGVKTLQNRCLPDVGAGGAVGIILVAICVLVFFFGSAPWQERSQGPANGQQNRRRAPSAPPRIRPRAGFVPPSPWVGDVGSTVS